MVRRIFADFDMDSIHLILTWIWIISGVFSQFFMVCRNIKAQDYLPRFWKILVVISSAFMLGPTMINAFCIGDIIVFKLGIGPYFEGPNRPTISLLEKKVVRALQFSSQAKLGEVFSESVPQFFTQLIMTSAKGDGGSRELTFLQTLSVTSSAISISMGISNYIIESGSKYFSHHHSRMTTRLILVLVILLELLYCGGISRISCAFYAGQIPLVALLMPLIAMGFTFHGMQLVNDKCCVRNGDYLFLIFHFFIWFSVIAIFLASGSCEEGVRALRINNSLIEFCVTITVIFVANLVIGFLIRKQTTNFILYVWIDGLLIQVANTLVARGLIEHQDSYPNEISTLEKISIQMSNVPKPVGITRRRSMSDCIELLKDDRIVNASSPNSPPTLNSQSEVWDENMQAQLPRHKFSRNAQKFFSWLYAIISLTLLMGVLVYICSRQIAHHRPGYHVTFHSRYFLKNMGFPLVSYEDSSEKGSICLENRTGSEILKVAIVAAQQLGIFPNPKLFIDPEKINTREPKREISLKATLMMVGNMDYMKQTGQRETRLEIPYLQPTCLGSETNLIDCQQYGLSVLLDPPCYESKNRLYISAFQRRYLQNKPPNFIYLVMDIREGFAKARLSCRDVRLPSDVSATTSSHIFDSNWKPDEMSMLFEQFKLWNLSKIWFDDRKFVPVNGMIDWLIADDDNEDAKYTVCKVYGNFYSLQCGPLGVPNCGPCETVDYGRNRYWEIECVCKPRQGTTDCTDNYNLTTCPVCQETERVYLDRCGCATFYCGAQLKRHVAEPTCGVCEKLISVDIGEFKGDEWCPSLVPECVPMRCKNNGSSVS